MPGPQSELLDQDGTCKKQKRKKSSREEGSVVTFRKIRVIYSDPYATDSSSDEGDRCKNNGAVKIKRFLTEIPVSCVKRCSKDGKNGGKTGTSTRNNVRPPRTASLHKGVRIRKSGKYAAEIRDPIRKVRIWLGTYNLYEEARSAYLNKKLEFERMLLAEERKSQIDGDTIFLHLPPLSVLDVLAATLLCNGIGNVGSVKEEDISVVKAEDGNGNGIGIGIDIDNANLIKEEDISVVKAEDGNGIGNVDLVLKHNISLVKDGDEPKQTPKLSVLEKLLSSPSSIVDQEFRHCFEMDLAGENDLGQIFDDGFHPENEIRMWCRSSNRGQSYDRFPDLDVGKGLSKEELAWVETLNTSPS